MLQIQFNIGATYTDIYRGVIDKKYVDAYDTNICGCYRYKNMQVLQIQIEKDSWADMEFITNLTRTGVLGKKCYP